MKTAAKRKSILLLLTASALLLCAPNVASSDVILPSKTRAEKIFNWAQNRLGSETFEPVKRDEKYDVLGGSVLGSSLGLKGAFFRGRAPRNVEYVSATSASDASFSYIRKIEDISGLEAKVANRTITRAEWKLYSRELRSAGQAVPTGSANSNFIRHSRFDTAYRFYLNEGGFAAGRIRSHLDGIDFTKPVSVVDIPRGTRLSQHVVPGRRIGNYFAEAGTPASQLGINPAGRVTFLLQTPFGTRALRSTSAQITDTWTVPGQAFQAQGGGLQYFVPNQNVFTVGY